MVNKVIRGFFMLDTSCGGLFGLILKDINMLTFYVG